MSAPMQSTVEFVDLRLSDWEGARTAHLDQVPRSSTIGQVVSEAVQQLGLPLGGLFKAVFRGVELDPAGTVDELGIASDSEIELVPEVSAGCG
ncbi:MAG: hypothetical protein V3U03_00545 [Myxococcota bacterium]